MQTRKNTSVVSIVNLFEYITCTVNCWEAAHINFLLWCNNNQLNASMYLRWILKPIGFKSNIADIFKAVGHFVAKPAVQKALSCCNEHWLTNLIRFWYHAHFNELKLHEHPLIIISQMQRKKEKSIINWPYLLLKVSNKYSLYSTILSIR